MMSVPCEAWDMAGYSYGAMLAAVLASTTTPVEMPRPISKLLLVAPAIDQARRNFSDSLDPSAQARHEGLARAGPAALGRPSLVAPESAMVVQGQRDENKYGCDPAEVRN